MDLAKEIFTLYGFSELELRPLEASSHKLFDVRFRQSGNYRRAVLRIYDDWLDRKNVEAEAEWLKSLSTETDLLVPNPIPVLDGSIVQDLDLAPDSDVSFAVLHAWLPGELLAVRVSSARIREVGRILACLHNHSATAMERDRHSSRRQAFEVWVED